MTDDFYCDFVLNGKIEVDVVLETPNVLAYRHTRPFWEHHIVVVPKRHVPSLLSVGVDDSGLLMELLSVIQEVASELNVRHGGARVLTNLGKYQDSKHLHFHVCSGNQLKVPETT